MKIEIWSDVVCPFCYIGKRKFERALAEFEHADEVEVEWKSFLLSPGIKTDPSKNIHEYLAEHKNISVEEATGMNDHVAHMAAQVGLEYNFDTTIPANSINAHRFLHFTKKYGKQNEAEEKLFAAYFTEGKNIDAPETLIGIATSLGLDSNELINALGSDAYADDVMADIEDARQLGLQGVPFFVLNRKYGISGAQDNEVFLKTMRDAYNDKG